MPKVYPQNNFEIKNCTFISMPWEKFAMYTEENITNGCIDNCLLIRTSWRQWFVSLFTHKIKI